MKINIHGLNKALVLVAFYDEAISKTCPAASSTPRENTLLVDKMERATQLLAEQNSHCNDPHYLFSSIDLGDGPRKLSLELFDSVMDCRNYEVLYGVGIARKIILKLYEELQKKIEMNSCTMTAYETVYSGIHGEKWKERTRRPPFSKPAFEQFLMMNHFNAEAVTPVVVQYDKIASLAAIYVNYGFNKSEMLGRHLVQLAKSTNEPDVYEFSSLFFSNCLDYLVAAENLPARSAFFLESTKSKKLSSVGIQIAQFLSPEFYAENSYCFDKIRKDMFSYWIEYNPDQIIAIIIAVLKLKKTQHNTPIEHFLFELSTVGLPPEFYDRLAILLSNNLLNDNLTPEQFIMFFTEIREDCQNKILSTLLIDESCALNILKKLCDAYHASNFSPIFSRVISSKLKSINPDLHQQAKQEQWFVKENKDNLERDFSDLKQILANQSLSHDERRRYLGRLKHLQAALDNPDTRCPVVIQMFDRIPQKNWTDLFVYFDTDITVFSFPDNRRLALLLSDSEASPDPQTNSWLSYQEKWESILYGGLVAVLADISTRRDVSHWALGSLDIAFVQSEEHFPGMSERVLKKFFLKMAPESIQIFTAIFDMFRDKYHAPQYFSKDELFNQVASWLPEDIKIRAARLADLFRVKSRFDQALEYPFVRNNDELIQTGLVLINTSKEHLLNLFEKISSIHLQIIFKGLYQLDPDGFLNLIKLLLANIGASPIPGHHYVRYVLILLSNSKKANIDIFKIIEEDPHKNKLINHLLEPQTLSFIDGFPCEYETIFSIVQQFRPEQLQNLVVQLILLNINDKESLLIERKLNYCLQAILKVTDKTFVWPETEKQIFTDYLIKILPGTIERYSTSQKIETIAHFIPYADQLLVSLLEKTNEKQSGLSDKQKHFLDNLVRIYGFPHVNTLCLKRELIDCSTYLVERFSHFPELLQVTDDIVDACYPVMKEYKPPIKEEIIRRFFDNLRTAIVEAARKIKTKPFELDIVQIGIRSGVPMEALQLMPDYRSKASGMDSSALLLTNSWDKSGLLPASSSSSDCSSTISPKI